MSSVINESMTSREMLDMLVAKNMEDARQAKKGGANSYVGQVLLRLVNFARQWVFILFTLKPCCSIIQKKVHRNYFQYAEAKAIPMTFVVMPVTIWLIWM